MSVPPSPFPAFCVHGPQTPPPTTLCAAPQFVEALEALFQRAQSDEATREHTLIATTELLDLRTHEKLLTHAHVRTILATYAVLRPFLVS